MKKSLIAIALSTAFLAGCGESKVEEKQTETKEVAAVEEATSDEDDESLSYFSRLVNS